MEKLSEESQFGMADNVGAEVVRDGKVLENATVVADNAADSVGLSDEIEDEAI